MHPKDFEHVLADNLLVLTQICKQSKEYYPGVKNLDICNDLVIFLKGDNRFLKVKVCNLVGQMCKHSDFFYEDLDQAGVFPEMIKLCGDDDKVVKKASSFAIGNAAYYSDTLYETLSPAILYIVALLKDNDERIKTNSIGTISNLTRNSDHLVPEILNYEIPSIFVDLLLYDNSLTVKKLVLHAFRNFFKHSKILKTLKGLFDEKKKKQLNALAENTHNSDLAKHIFNVKKKLGIK